MQEIWGRNKLSEDLWYPEESCYHRGTVMKCLFHLMRIQINWSGNSIKSCCKDWIDVPIIVHVERLYQFWDFRAINDVLRIDFLLISSVISFTLFHNSDIWRCANKKQSYWRFSLFSRGCLKRKMSFSFTLYLFWCRLNVVRWKFVCSQYLNNM